MVQLTLSETKSIRVSTELDMWTQYNTGETNRLRLIRLLVDGVDVTLQNGSTYPQMNADGWQQMMFEDFLTLSPGVHTLELQGYVQGSSGAYVAHPGVTCESRNSITSLPLAPASRHRS